MRIFVTGATGVVGRRAVPLIVSAGHEVTAVGRSREKLEALERRGASAREVDLFDGAWVRRAMAGHDVVINLATHIPPMSVSAFLPGAWKENDHIRSDGSRLLTEAALELGVKRFIQESFAPIYPDHGSRWIDESVEPHAAHNTHSVLDAETSADRFTRGGGVGVVLRFGLFYGARDEITLQMFRSVARGWLPLFGSPDGFVSMINQDDAATAVVAALDLPAGVYNVVDDLPLTRRQLGDEIASLLGVPPPKILPRWVARMTGSVGETLSRSLRISNHKLREASSWTPRYPNAHEGWQAALRSFPELRPGASDHSITA
jgi:nucleoside-diphosphate-sugar epimerase